MMNTRVFQIDSARELRPSNLETAISEASPSAPAWIDVRFEDTSELDGLLQRLALHPLVVETCKDESPVPRLAAYGDSLVLPFPFYAAWPPDDRSYLTFVCLPNLMVSLHRSDCPALEEVILQYCDGMRFHDRRTSAILYQVIDHLIDDEVAFVKRVRDELELLDGLLEQDDDEAIARATPLKHHLSRISATFEDQLFSVRSLQTIESRAFQVDGLRDYFRDAVAQLDHICRATAQQQAHLAAIQQGYHLKLQDKTNDQLRVLTIISTVFMPLTLITGIYGMNFRYMPELEYRYGYFVTLAAMVTIAAGMLVGFLRAGWFR